MTVDSSDIRRLERTVEAVERKLSRDLDLIDHKLEVNFAEVHDGVGRIHADLTTTQTELLALRRKFDEYVDEAARVARIQRSETKIGNLKSELDRQYGHYAVVRRTSVGILQAFDVGNVTNHTVGFVSEELMIQSPRYWLAPAIVAVAAWSRDDQDIATRSLNEAFSRDQQKTSLFFALILRRQGRTEGAVRWLRHYFASLDPAKLTREFAVILEATAQGAFGTAGVRAPAERIAAWMTDLRADPAIVDAQVERWRRWLTVNSRAVDASSYEALAATSPEWPIVKAQLEAASALPQSTDALVAIRDADVPTRIEYNELLDDLLEQLVTEYDAEELPLRREVTYHEAIIEEDGDADRAQTRADMLNDALEETIDVVTLQTMSAISPEAIGVSVQTQRVGIGTSQPDLRAAVGVYTAEYRSRAVDRVQFGLGREHSGYAQTLGFVGWTGDSTEPEDRAMHRLAEAWAQTVQNAITAASFKPTTAIVPGIVLSFIVLFFFMANAAEFGVIALLLGGLGVGGYVYWKKTEADKEVARIRGVQHEATAHSQGIARQARAEFVDATITYQQLDALEPTLLRVVDTWPTTSREENR